MLRINWFVVPIVINKFADTSCTHTHAHTPTTTKSYIIWPIFIPIPQWNILQLPLFAALAFIVHSSHPQFISCIACAKVLAVSTVFRFSHQTSEKIRTDTTITTEAADGVKWVDRNWVKHRRKAFTHFVWVEWMETGWITMGDIQSFNKREIMVAPVGIVNILWISFWFYRWFDTTNTPLPPCY